MAFSACAVGGAHPLCRRPNTFLAHNRAIARPVCSTSLRIFTGARSLRIDLRSGIAFPWLPPGRRPPAKEFHLRAIRSKRRLSMLGFILGAACVIGVGRMLRRRAWRNHFGYGGYDGGCQGGSGWRGGHGMRFGGPPGRVRAGRWALRSFFERLETTPGQERVILSALDELRENRKVVRDELKLTKGDLAHAIEGGLIDDASLEDSFARHDRLLAQLRVGFIEALKKMTEALDE